MSLVSGPAQVVPDPCACVQRAAALALPADGRVLLAVSGGSDSVALLGAAHAALGRELHVAHVRHGLRPDDGRDASLVEALCRDLGLPCRTVHAAPVGGRDSGTETASRRRRLAALAAVARDAGCGAVLTAHHADDARETVLLQLERGHRGDRALAGIPALRRLSPGAVLLRPFLIGPRTPGREVLARYRRARELPCVEDPTNADTRVPRNAVRAWLAGRDAAFRARLDATRLTARRRLEARVLGAAAALERGLRPEGLGARLEASAFAVPGTAAEVRAHRAELLRLLAACLARPRRADPRGAALDALQDALAAGHGRVRLPAQPAPLDLLVSPRDVHLPDEAPASGSAWGRVLAGVSAGSLHP